MDTKLLARIGAIIFVAIAITVAVVEAMRPAPAPREPTRTAREAVSGADPLREALVRCQALGAAAAEDTRCMRAWAESRRRFFARDRAEAERLFDFDSEEIEAADPAPVPIGAEER